MTKHLLVAAAVFFSTVAASPSHATQCGSGHIVDYKEGGWNSDDFMIKLEGINAGGSTTLWQGFVRFKSSDISAARLDAIRRLAATAFALDAKVWTFSHNGDCSSATEMSMIQ